VDVISTGLAAHGRGNVVMPPKAHLHLDHLFAGHFNILSGYVGPIGRAGGGRRSAAWNLLSRSPRRSRDSVAQTGQSQSVGNDRVALTWLDKVAMVCPLVFRQLGNTP
jgi:hypothetical protein